MIHDCDRTRTDIGRRRFLGRTSQLVYGSLATSWMSRLARGADAAGVKPFRSCILLWMNGGPSQTDTFDMKPRHANGGPFKEIETAASAIRICEHLPNLAKCGKDLAVIRSMSTREGDHGRARQHLRTGYMPQASIQFPVFGSLVSNARTDIDSDLPNYVSILPRGLFSPGIPAAGFLGPDHSPLLVDADRNGDMTVQDLSQSAAGDSDRQATRAGLLRTVEKSFLADRPGAPVDGHRSAYERATRLMSPAAAKSFRIDEEPLARRTAFGNTSFGKACLLASRLVERRVPFVEVTLNGWDTHDNNFEAVQALCGQLDTGWSALLNDLRERGLLESTLVVWMGEFGRTPVINPRQGRDHYPAAWSAVLAGGGIQGGTVVGRTGDDGLAVTERPVSTPDLLATICTAIGLNPAQQNMSNVGRPIRVVSPEAKPITELL